MKHLLLFVIAAILSLHSFGQKTTVIHGAKQVNALANLNKITETTGLTSNKETAYGDTLYMTHIALTDTITLYYIAHDSGFVSGMNAYGDQGFAERYDFSGTDSTVRVIGVIARFGGTVMPTSTKSIIFKTWYPAQKTSSVRPSLYNSGLPGATLTSATVKLTDLGLATSDTTEDSAKLFLFPTPTYYLSQHFFVGYTTSYVWGSPLQGDTIGLYSNKDGERTAPSFTALSTEDTTINNVNVTQFADGKWHDNAVDNFVINNNLYIFPVVMIGAGITSVNGITRNNFTFYGNYPNPASNSTNIKIGLAKPADVSISVMDIRGTTVATVKQPALSIGDHTITIPTRDLAAGDYVYLIRTSTGDGIASKMTVSR